MVEIDFSKIEKKWQDGWASEKVFEVSESSDKPKFYSLEMFPYPSGSGLHLGHTLNYVIGDVFARFKRMQGFNLLHPIGYDSLGLPAENAAIRSGEHPIDYTEKSTKNFEKQFKSLGMSFDWSRLVNTSSPDYYKWDQWIFLKMLEKGLAYQKEASVNWCPSCKTVLANEQAQGGVCERCKSKVELKVLKQWFLKITDYAEELLENLPSLDWPQQTKTMQKNWIGKSKGVEIYFEIEKPGESFDGKFPVFTTRPDTIYGVTFMVLSAQHPRLFDFVTKDREQEVQDFLKRLKSVSEKEFESLDKEGVFTGSYAVNPVTNEKVPIYAGNFVVADYASGMVMAVPAHDQRDFEFAKKYEIPIKIVISPLEGEELTLESLERAYVSRGKLVNSENFNGLDNFDAKEKITSYLVEKGFGKKKVNFKLRDWLISRQRYWGTPIPVVYCDKCGVVPVKEEDLPVTLPRDVKFGEGNPLETNEEWRSTRCPSCGGPAKRETDTMDTFVNSSWYFLRYTDPKNNNEIFDTKKAKYWCPVDQYIGGAEHACMHLIYSRFYTKFLRDIGLINFGEPFKRLFHQGMLHGEDGEKMSKSNPDYVILPEVVSKKYGMDTARMFLLSVASPDKDIDWSEKGINGTLKFIKKLFDFFENVKITNDVDAKVESKLNKAIKEVGPYIEGFKYNLALIKIRELFSLLFSYSEVSKDVLSASLKLISPFCPHISEELWERIGNKGFISLEKWPKVDESKIDETFDKTEELTEKLVGDILNVNKILESRNEFKDKVYVYVLPQELESYLVEELSKRTGKVVKVFSVSDKEKHDPEGVSKKAKPGKPGIYFE